MNAKQQRSLPARWHAALCSLCMSASLFAAEDATATLTVQVNKPGATPTQFGIFFEDINFAADGGLYAELVKNRSFEFTNALMGWHAIARNGAVGRVAVRTEDPLNGDNPHYARLSVETPGQGYGLSNEGFRGVPVKKGAVYAFSVYARSSAPTPPELLIELETTEGRALGVTKLSGVKNTWKKLSCTVTASETDPKAQLNVIVRGQGFVDLDMVSLFPRDTWKKRPGGLRADLVQLLADMKPALVRFPGGCIVEGRTLENRYQWKKTIGDVSERKFIMNRWNNEFAHRATPDYYQSFGLGFYEYFLMCEDIGAKPLPILNCGMACQFNSKELAPLDQLDPYIQDALDLIEFANGPATSVWGRKRAEMGHSKPFQMTMLGVGNEQWGPQYFERYEKFAAVLKAKHPEIKLVTSSGPSPNGKDFDYAWGRLREFKADIIDEHYYQSPAWFFNNVNRYDKYDRNGPKVFAGEFAAHGPDQGKPWGRNHWECALAEAALMTGLERNSDMVVMASYAPLFAHVDAWQWTPNLIWFDSQRSFGTPNYYVQQLFSAHRGAAVLPAALSGNSDGIYASSMYNTKTREVIVKVVNHRPAARTLRLDLAGARNVKSKAKSVVLASADLMAYNTLETPNKVVPIDRTWTASGTTSSYVLDPYSVNVLRIACEN